MKDRDQSVVESLDGQDPALLPFIPYLLQDFWELGAHPDDVAGLLLAHGLALPRKAVLDLGCGKGAVAVPLARRFGLRVTGVDAFPPFVEEARRRAEEHGVTALCEFRADDVRVAVAALRGFDIAILSGTGPLFGTYEETIRALRPCLVTGGHVVLDDAFVEDGKSEESGRYTGYSELHRQLRAAGATVVDERLSEMEEVGQACDVETGWIRRRADELALRHPNLAGLFDGYVRAQEAESRVLATQVRCVLWLLRL